MDPVYTNIPHQRDQLHYSPYPSYPGARPVPPQTYAHHGRPPVNYGYAPWCTNYGYMPPIAGHGCCSHYPFVPLPPPYAHHFPGSYPSYPTQYTPPSPSCYPMEYPTGGPHCCGCPNHLPQPGEQRNVRIEEEALADGERRGKNDSFSPLVWMPPDYSKNNEGKHLQEEDGNGGFPLPLFWLPYKPEEKELEKHDSKGLDMKPSPDHAKDVGKHEEKEGSKNDQGKERVVPVKDSLDHGEKKVSKESVKKKSPSPKSSKLPPVCLRVDPLPRKKNANGSSQKQDSQSDGAKSKILNTNDVKEGKRTKTVEVVDGKTWQERVKDVNVETPVNPPEQVETPVNPPEQMAKVENTSRECLGTGEELFGDKDGRREEVKQMDKRKLSEDEAAVVIQKVYRGFETRRWDPMKKLKEIAKVREEMGSVKRMIQAMESSSDTEGSSKQSTVISETIMSLLLKVDSIQGLHPTMREVRKSVAKELVSLQEKLDSSVNSPQKGSSSRFPEDTSNKIEDIKLSENVSGETPSESHKVDQIQPDGAPDCENLEISKANPNGEKSMETPEKEEEKSNEELELHNDATDKENIEMHHVLDLPLEEVEVGSDEMDTKTGDDHSKPEEMPHVLDIPLGEVNVGLDEVDTKTGDAQSEPEELHRVLDLPLGEVNVGLDEVNTKTGDDQSQPEECINQQPRNSTTEPSLAEQDMSGQLLQEGTAIGMENHEATEENANGVAENDHALDLLLSEVNVGSEEVDTKARADQSEPEERVDQVPQNSTADIVEPSLTEQEMSTQLLHKGTTIEVENHKAIEEMHHVLDLPLSEVNVGSDEMHTKTGDDKSNPEECVDQQPQNSTTGIVEPSVTQQENHKAVEENANGDGKIGVEDKMDVVLSEQGEDGLMESNRKLLEENERLRGMMENLIRSGQEQVSAISLLTGRVKDLERRISSKRNKLKVRRGSKITRAQ